MEPDDAKNPTAGNVLQLVVNQNNQDRRGTLPIREKLDRWADKADLISLALIADDYTRRERGEHLGNLRT